MYFWDDDTELWPTTGKGLLATCVWYLTVCLLHVLTTSYRFSVTHICNLCFHIVRSKARIVGDREILETYLNSASKIHQKQAFFLLGQNFCLPVLFVYHVLLTFCLQEGWIEEYMQIDRVFNQYWYLFAVMQADEEMLLQRLTLCELTL
jgi:hypothetical protein